MHHFQSLTGDGYFLCNHACGLWCNVVGTPVCCCWYLSGFWSPLSISSLTDDLQVLLPSLRVVVGISEVSNFISAAPPDGLSTNTARISESHCRHLSGPWIVSSNST